MVNNENMERVADVKVKLQDGLILDCRVSFSTVPPYHLRLEGIKLGHNEFVADDLFAAMVLLRRELEIERLTLLCAGARIDTFPSPMMQSGSGGLRAFITRLGQPANPTDIVSIFDYADARFVGTVEEQTSFHKEWVDSLRKRPVEIVPTLGELEEAKRFPNGYIYRISGEADPVKGIPPEAILGAWQVNAAGEIVGSFISNTDHDPIRWPFSEIRS